MKKQKLEILAIAHTEVWLATLTGPGKGCRKQAGTKKKRRKHREEAD